MAGAESAAPSPRSRIEALLRKAAPLAVLLVASVLFRLPPVVSADAINSDAAVVALQAKHMLAGEWSWFLWGIGYQSSVDPLSVAVGFWIGGVSARALVVVMLVGHLAIVTLGYVTLRRRLERWTAAFACAPLVFTPMAINLILIYGARQWCIVALFGAVALLDGASQARRPVLSYAAGAALAAVSLYLDLYALQVVPAVALFGLLCALDSRPGAVTRIGALVGGGLLGAVPVVVLRHGVQAQGTLTSLARLGPNFDLFWNTCLPYLLGAKVFIPGQNLYPDLWQPPAPVRILEVLAAVSLAVGTLAGGAAFFLRRIDWRVRRLGVLGAVAAVTSAVAFHLSSMPADMHSARYLGPIVWMAPFALAPIAASWPARRFGLAIAPYALSAAIGGWLANGPEVRGLLPVHEPAAILDDERQLRDALRSAGVRYAAGDYWLAYRLTFLFDEDPIVVPLVAGQDRYPPYRRGFVVAPVIAYVVHPSDPRVPPEAVEQMLRRAGVRYERRQAGRYTYFLYTQIIEYRP